MTAPKFKPLADKDVPSTRRKKWHRKSDRWQVTFEDGRRIAYRARPKWHGDIEQWAWGLYDGPGHPRYTARPGRALTPEESFASLRRIPAPAKTPTTTNKRKTK